MKQLLHWKNRTDVAELSALIDHVVFLPAALNLLNIFTAASDIIRHSHQLHSEARETFPQWHMHTSYLFILTLYLIILDFHLIIMTF